MLHISLEFIFFSSNQLNLPAEVFEEVLEIVSYMTFFSPTISMDMWTLWPLMMVALADWAIDFFPSMCRLFNVTVGKMLFFEGVVWWFLSVASKAFLFNKTHLLCD